MNSKLKQRKNVRLKDYDYSQIGMYFITICTKDRKEILSRINKKIDINEMVEYIVKIVGVGVLDDPIIKLLRCGKITKKYIKNMNEIYNDFKINHIIIMPNHVHFIIEIQNKNGSSRTPTPTNRRIPFIISTLKRLINKELNDKIWQRNYYEHIIRNEKEYKKIIEYIYENPLRWVMKNK